MELLILVLVVGGLFGLCSALHDWNWFARTRRAQVLIRRIGQPAARLVYGGAGFLAFYTGLVALLTR